jgi:hypothetical protein
MSNVQTIDQFKARKLRKLEDEYADYVRRGIAFEKEGKKIFAQQMIVKADEIRKEIKKLRPDIPVPLVQSNQSKAPYLNLTYEYTSTGPYTPFFKPLTPTE